MNYKISAVYNSDTKLYDVVLTGDKLSVVL